MKQFLAWLLSLFTAVVPVASPAPVPQPALMTFGGFRYATMAVDNLSRLELFSNLDNQENAADLAKKKTCYFLTNAGFYDTQNHHLGWFYTQGKTISSSINSRLFDGFLSLQDGEAVIGFDRPETVVWGVQSGPMLIYDAKPLKLTIKDDQPRRRVVAALTRDQQLIFLVILSPQSDYSGPLLAETPKLLLALNPEIVTAINLDGGSASAFITPEVSLKEYQPIGGYFCYTKL